MLAEKQKARGNAFLKEGKFLEAVTSYTLAINLDGNNHVYYRWQLIFDSGANPCAPCRSNRSAANASLKEWIDCLSDAQRCIELKGSSPFPTCATLRCFRPCS